jgi:hypothetical protein
VPYELVGIIVPPFDSRPVPGVGCISRGVSHSIDRRLSVLDLVLGLELELELVARLLLDWHRLVMLPVLLPVMLLVLLIVLFSRLRPGRLAKKYWHVMPRHSHFEHDGFSLGHLTLEMAQAWQLSRSFDRDDSCLRVRSTWVSDSKSNIAVRWIAPRAEPRIVIQTAHRRHCAVSYHKPFKVLTRGLSQLGRQLGYELS